MGAVTTSLTEQAESIFADMGYSVSNDESGLRAERKWRVVHVTLDVPDPIPTTGDFRCFVTRAEAATRTCRKVEIADPDYEWAVIGVDDDGEYDVYRRPTVA